MPIFKKTDKDGNRCINIAAYDGISVFRKGLALRLTLTEDKLKIAPRLGNGAEVTLPYSQIKNLGIKSAVKNKRRLIISYIPKSGRDAAAISFESVGATLGLDKFTDELRTRCGFTEKARDKAISL